MLVGPACSCITTQFAKIAVDWLKWTLKGDEAAGAIFAGADCGLCADPNWEVAQKGL